MTGIWSFSVLAIYTYAVWQHGWKKGRRTTLDRLKGQRTQPLKNWWAR